MSREELQGKALECNFRNEFIIVTQRCWGSKKGKPLSKMQKILKLSEQLMLWCLIFETLRFEHAV